MDGSQVIAFARRLGTLVAGWLREGVARKVQRPSLAMVRVLAVLVVAVILAVALALRFIVMWGPAGGATTAKAADPVVMFKNPDSANLWLCDKASGRCTAEGEGQLTVNEEVANIPGDVHIGSFEFVVYFSGRVVSVTATEGPFLASTGRHTECHQEQTENWLRFGCTSMGSEPGPTGSGVLAYLTLTPNITFRPTRSNGVFVHLIDSQSEAGLSDELGNPVPVDEVGDSTILLRALEGDVNYDCRVNVIDDQSVSGRYGLHFGSIWYQTLYDLEPMIPDDDVDIKDLQFVFGRNYTTCEEIPTPEVTPTPTPGAGTYTATPTSTTTPAAPTITATPGSATPTSTAATPTPGSATPTPTASTVTPTQTPSAPHHKHTPTASPIPGSTSTPVASVTPPPTPSAVETVAPTGRTPGPVTTTSPAEVTRATAEALPPSGTGAGAVRPGADGWLLAIAAALAVLGWVATLGAVCLGVDGLARSMSEKVRSRTRR